MSSIDFFCNLAEPSTPFPHFWEHTVGSDHTPVALRADWQRQLKRCHDRDYPDMTSKYGFKCSYNPTFTSGKRKGTGWVSQGYYGLDQGPIVMMIENYRSGLPWRLMRQCPHIVNGLRRAGFRGGWLGTG
jgi:hypothetical protein